MEQVKELKEQVKSNITLNGNRPLSKLEGEIGTMASDIASNIKDVSADIMKDSVAFVKRYPLHTAVGALAVGVVAGMFIKPTK